MLHSTTKPAASEPDLIWQYFGCKKEGFFVEVGANDPDQGSQTSFLEKQGWKGILVEPLSKFYQPLCRARPNSRVFQAAAGPPGHPAKALFHEAETSGHSSLAKNLIDSGTKYVRTEEVVILTLDEILAQAGNPKIDFVSIDVEGMQLEVLQGFDLEKHHPALVLVEDHLHNLKTHLYLKRRGYRLEKRTGLNNWYVPRESAVRLSSWPERLKLWKKIWANTPFRKLRLFLEKKRADSL